VAGKMCSLCWKSWPGLGWWQDNCILVDGQGVYLSNVLCSHPFETCMLQWSSYLQHIKKTCLTIVNLMETYHTHLQSASHVEYQLRKNVWYSIHSLAVSLILCSYFASVKSFKDTCVCFISVLLQFVIWQIFY